MPHLSRKRSTRIFLQRRDAPWAGELKVTMETPSKLPSTDIHWYTVYDVHTPYYTDDYIICIGIELYGYVYIYIHIIIYIYIYNSLYVYNVYIHILINKVHCVQLCKLVLLGLTGISLHFLGILMDFEATFDDRMVNEGNYWWFVGDDYSMVIFHSYVTYPFISRGTFPLQAIETT